MTISSNRSSCTNSRGFTIIELLIATLVFSVILLLLTTALIRIGQIYNKGIVTSRTQEVSRKVIDDVAQTVQFSGGYIGPGLDAGGAKAFCIGAQRYSYAPDQQLTATSPHRFVVDTVAGGCTSATTARTDMSDLSTVSAGGSGAQELLGQNMRLVNFQIAEQNVGSGVYKIGIRIVSGDKDLLMSPNPAYADIDAAIAANATDLRCRDDVRGAYFCAVSEVEAYAAKRVN